MKRKDFFTIKNGRIKLANGGYKPTSDTIWLADSVEAKGRASVLDAGVGSGGVALCLLDKNPNLKITGVDLSEEMVSRAWINAVLNKREIDLIQADILTWRTKSQFDVVVTNPPFFAGTPKKSGAHHNADIYKWTAAAAKRLRARGFIYIIVPPGALDKVVAALYDSKCGEITIRPIETSKGIERVVISGRLGVKSPARLLPPVKK
jgi:tRNA1Val (adenine37-N6)-methyltransferase